MTTWWPLVLGGLLFAVGPVGYVGSGYASKTALIPSLFGLLLGLCGWMSTAQGALRLPWWCGGLLVALLGVLGSYKGMSALFVWLKTGETAKPLAVVAKVSMTVSCSAYLLISVFLRFQQSRS